MDGGGGVCIAQWSYFGIDYFLNVERYLDGRFTLTLFDSHSSSKELHTATMDSTEVLDGTANKCRLNITFNAGSFTIDSSQWGSTTPTGAFAFVFDATTILPDANMPVSYGVVSRDNQQTLIELIDYPDKYYPYVKLDVDANGNQTKTFSYYKGTTWSTPEVLAYGDYRIPYGRMVFSPMTGISYFTRRDGSLRKLPTMPLNPDGTPYSP